MRRLTRGSLPQALRRLPSFVPLLLAVVLVMGVVAPITDSGMRGDDSHLQADIDGLRKAEGMSLATLIGDTIETSVVNNGRPQPFGVVEGLTYATVFDERVPYKLGLAALTLACVLALMAFLQMFRVPRSVLLVVAVAFALSLQFRMTHDPALGYYSTPQFSLLVFFAGLATYLRYLRGGSWRWFAATVALVVLLLGTYEANYPLVLAFAALHLGHDPGRVRSWRPAVPILAMGAVMLLVATYSHGQVEAPPEGYATSLDVIAVALTAARQALSGVPNIYFLSGSQGLLAEPTAAELLGAFWRAALAGLLAIGAFALARSERSSPARTDAASASPARVPAAGAGQVAAVGLVLMAGSGLLISLAPQHQQGITLGSGHLATLSGTLGFCMVAAGVWMQWGRELAARAWLIAVAGVTVFVMAFAGQYSNLRIVAVERPGIEQRELFTAGLDQGVLDDVDTKTTVFVTNRDLNWSFGNLVFYGGTIDYLAYLRTDRRMDIRAFGPPSPPCEEPPRFPLPDCAAQSPRVAWLATRASRDGGLVLVADGIPTGRVEDRGARRVTAVARGVTATGDDPPLIGTGADGKPWVAADASWDREPLEDGWVRYSATFSAASGPLAPSLNDPRSSVDFVAGATPPQSVRIFGTKHLLP